MVSSVTEWYRPRHFQLCLPSLPARLLRCTSQQQIERQDSSLCIKDEDLKPVGIAVSCPNVMVSSIFCSIPSKGFDNLVGPAKYGWDKPNLLTAESK